MRFDWVWDAIAIGGVILSVVGLSLSIGSLVHRVYRHQFDNLYAMVVETRLEPCRCECGYCDPERGIAVPEHVNRVGYDLKEVTVTNYWPVVRKEKK